MARIEIDANEFANDLERYAIDSMDDLLNDETLKLRIASEFERYCEPYVPFLTGMLAQTTEVTPDYVEYTVPYAHYQYVGENFNHTTTFHPLATAYWDRVMLETQGDEFLEQVNAHIHQRASETPWFTVLGRRFRRWIRRGR